MSKPTMKQQAAAVRDAVATLHKRMGEPELSWLIQAEATLEALGGMEELMRAAYRLQKENPGLAEIFQAFPGSRIVDFRDKDTNEENHDDEEHNYNYDEDPANWVWDKLFPSRDG